MHTRTRGGALPPRPQPPGRHPPLLQSCLIITQLSSPASSSSWRIWASGGWRELCVLGARKAREQGLLKKRILFGPYKILLVKVGTLSFSHPSFGVSVLFI